MTQGEKKKQVKERERETACHLLLCTMSRMFHFPVEWCANGHANRCRYQSSRGHRDETFPDAGQSAITWDLTIRIVYISFILDSGGYFRELQ